jgi:hypothetical protein
MRHLSSKIRLCNVAEIWYLPRLSQNPKICRFDDADVIGDRIAVFLPILGHVLTQNVQHFGAEIRELRVTPVVRDRLQAFVPIVARLDSRCRQYGGTKCKTMRRLCRPKSTSPSMPSSSYSRCRTRIVSSSSKSAPATCLQRHPLSNSTNAFARPRQPMLARPVPRQFNQILPSLGTLKIQRESSLHTNLSQISRQALFRVIVESRYNRNGRVGGNMTGQERRDAQRAVDDFQEKSR